jgi:methionine biosynthesis protein MetW
MKLPPELVQQWIRPQETVLDLGCGDGTLLGYGLEIDPTAINACVTAGVNVIEQDLDGGLSNFADGSFDTVVMTQTLQAVHYPHLVIDEMLRIGKMCILVFPNFGHWRCRMHLGIRGRMPVSKFLPYQWYDTPNIHFCTIADFESLCREKQISILNRRFLTAHGRANVMTRAWPNLCSLTAIYRITR